MILWLTGPSGSGKSTVAPVLASEMGAIHFDLDQEIEQVTGASISSLIHAEGERSFRVHETETIRRISSALQPNQPAVVACGAGAIETPGNLDLMRSRGLLVYLEVSEETAFRRLEGEQVRPLLASGPEQWSRLYQRRRPLYESADISVDGNLPASETARQIRTAVEQHIHPVWTRTFSPEPHHCLLEFYSNIASLVRRAEELSSHESFAISELRVRDLYPHTFSSLYGNQGGAAMTRPGELGKGFERVPELADRMLSAGIGRSGTLIGFGGGIITDLAGFLGSIYMRGIDTILIPTTLLAMVDAAIGGKTAVNSPRGVRNAIGTFAPPKAVLIAPQFLETLEARELCDGFVEMLKTGIVADSELFTAASAAAEFALKGDVPRDIQRLIIATINAKLRICEFDLRDHGRRIGLNLGHTFAHAIETTSPGSLTHGEAVALGIIAASFLAERRTDGGSISAERAEELRSVFARFVPDRFRLNDAADVVGAMQSDKKRGSGGIRFVLPLEENGGFDLIVEPPEELVADALRDAVIYSQQQRRS